MCIPMGSCSTFLCSLLICPRKVLHINDIDRDVTATIRLFADDCIVYRTINTDDCPVLTKRSGYNFNLSDTWQMKLNIEKRATLRQDLDVRRGLFISLKTGINDVHQYSTS